MRIKHTDQLTRRLNENSTNLLIFNENISEFSHLRAKMMYSSTGTEQLPTCTRMLEPKRPRNAGNEQTKMAKVKTVRVEREKPTDKQTSTPSSYQNEHANRKSPRLLRKLKRSGSSRSRERERESVKNALRNCLLLDGWIRCSVCLMALSTLKLFTATFPTVGPKWASHLISLPASCYSLHNIHTPLRWHTE